MSTHTDMIDMALTAHSSSTNSVELSRLLNLTAHYESGELVSRLNWVITECHNAKEDPHDRIKCDLTWDQLEAYLSLSKSIENTLSASMKRDTEYKRLLNNYTDGNDKAARDEARHEALEYAKSHMDKVIWDSIVSVNRDTARLELSLGDRCFWPLQQEVGMNVKEFAKSLGRSFERGGKDLSNAKLRTLGRTFAKALCSVDKSSTSFDKKNSALTSHIVSFLTGGKSESSEQKEVVRLELEGLVGRTVSESMGEYEWKSENLTIQAVIENLLDKRRTEMELEEMLESDDDDDQDSD